MASDSKKSTTNNTSTTAVYGLPGVDNSKVIPSKPIILKEDFTVPKPKREKSKRWNIFKIFGWG